MDTGITKCRGSKNGHKYKQINSGLFHDHGIKVLQKYKYRVRWQKIRWLCCKKYDTGLELPADKSSFDVRKVYIYTIF